MKEIEKWKMRKKKNEKTMKKCRAADFNDQFDD